MTIIFKQAKPLPINKIRTKHTNAISVENIDSSSNCNFKKCMLGRVGANALGKHGSYSDEFGIHTYDTRTV